MVDRIYLGDNQHLIPQGITSFRTPQGLTVEIAPALEEGVLNCSNAAFRSIETSDSAKRRRKIRKDNLRLLGCDYDNFYHQYAVAKPKRMAVYRRQQQSNNVPDLRSSEIELLQRVGRGMSVQQLADSMQLQPLQFASILSGLGRNGYIQLRGESCKKLFAEAQQAVKEAGEAAQDHVTAWRKHLMRLAGQEAVVRSAHPDRLKVASAPVRLTKKGDTFLIQLGRIATAEI